MNGDTRFAWGAAAPDRPAELRRQGSRLEVECEKKVE